MNTLLAFAMLSTGFVSGLHCIGMCGPLMSSIPLGSFVPSVRWGLWCLYQLGRISTYSLLGLLVSLAGIRFVSQHAGAYLSVLLGLLLLIAYVRHNGLHFGYAHFMPWLSKAYAGVRNIRQSMPRLFLLGMLNGLLPCGMVYTALALSISSPESSPLLMFLFGAGTLPVLFSLQVFREQFVSWLQPVYASFLKKHIPLFAALFLLYRGIIPLFMQASTHDAAHASGLPKTTTHLICKPTQHPLP